MKKSKYDTPKKGFSLAEALITLLIVCLITLASIPILTKKRRNLDEGQRGTWICSRNTNGDYVYWDKNNPVGQKDNPDSWTTTSKCVFTPPAGADRFSITVIGGGGGGGNGESIHEVLAKAQNGNSSTFSPSKTGLYDLIVIGGGGGGGDYQNTDSTQGGGGGSGSMFAGLLPLYQGSTYTLQSAGSACTGGAEYHGGSSNSTDHGWACGGKESRFYRTSGGDTKTDIIAGGGGGGEGVGCSKWKCRGGAAGGAGSVTRNNYYSSVTVDGKTEHASVGAYSGNGGGTGGVYNCNRNNIGGKNTFKDSAGNVSGFGFGGDGGTSCGSRAAKWGSGGLVVVSKNWKHYGSGGEAAIPNSYYLPSITGQLEAEIPLRAQAEMQGGNTVAKIVRNGITGRTFVGYGAKGGKANENLTEPGTGQHSQYNMKGGGTPAPDCTPQKQIPAGWGSITKVVPKCTKVMCNIELSEYNMDKNKKILQNNIDALGAEITPAGFTDSMFYGMKVPKQIKDGPDNNSTPPEDIKPFVWANKASKTEVESYFKNTLKIYYYVEKVIGTIAGTSGMTGAMQSRFPEYNDGDSDKTAFSNYSNKDQIYTNYRCYKDENITYQKQCAEEEMVEESSYGYHSQTVQPAICKDPGGPGTSFGAGGGGGNAADSAGVFSKGGFGGYGAVIVEW